MRIIHLRDQALSIKIIEALISVKFFQRGEKIFQHFIVEKKKGVSKYILDNRFLVNNKFEEKIKSYSLSFKESENYSFLERRDETDRVVLEFKSEEQIYQSNYYFVIPGFVPTSSGCESCKFRHDNKDDISFYCDYKQKTFTHKLKDCQFFRQQKELFKT